MRNWWDGLTDEQIEFAKSNRAPGELLTDAEWNIVQAIPTNELVKYKDSGVWESKANTTYYHRDDVTIYRLRPDWQRPEPEDDKRWVRYEVHKGVFNHYYFNEDGVLLMLSVGRERLNFLGIEYVEEPGKVYTVPVVIESDGVIEGAGDTWYVNDVVSVRPATPKYIYFAKGE
jgi:hypothetical protein